MNPKGRIDPTGETERITGQLAEAREMLAYLQAENRKLKAQRDDLLYACKMAVQHWAPGTTPSDRSTIVIMQSAMEGAKL